MGGRRADGRRYGDPICDDPDSSGRRMTCECSDWYQITIDVCQGKCKKRGHEVHNHIAAAIKRGDIKC
jgi:hypothetical protein